MGVFSDRQSEIFIDSNKRNPALDVIGADASKAAIGQIRHALRRAPVGTPAIPITVDEIARAGGDR